MTKVTITDSEGRILFVQECEDYLIAQGPSKAIEHFFSTHRPDPGHWAVFCIKILPEGHEHGNT